MCEGFQPPNMILGQTHPTATWRSPEATSSCGSRDNACNAWMQDLASSHFAVSTLSSVLKTKQCHFTVWRSMAYRALRKATSPLCLLHSKCGPWASNLITALCEVNGTLMQNMRPIPYQNVAWRLHVDYNQCFLLTFPDNDWSAS